MIYVAKNFVSYFEARIDALMCHFSEYEVPLQKNYERDLLK